MKRPYETLTGQLGKRVFCLSIPRLKFLDRNVYFKGICPNCLKGSN